MKRRGAQAAALSAAGLMMIAGCSGGRSVAAGPPLPVPSSAAAAQANMARATLSIKVPSPDAQSRNRKYVNTYTQYVNLWQTSGGTTVYSTGQFALGAPYCTGTGTYFCTMNLSIGSFPVYVSLYDGLHNEIATTKYTTPSPTTISANGSYYGNTVAFSPLPIAAKVVVEAPLSCIPNRNYNVTIDVMDADNVILTGAIANPFGIYWSTIAGATNGVYVGDTAHGNMLASGTQIANLSVYHPNIATTSNDSNILLNLGSSSAYGSLPVLRVGNTNFAAGAAGSFAMTSALVWSATGSTISAEGVVMANGSPYGQVACGILANNNIPGTHNFTAMTGSPGSAPDAMVILADSSLSGMVEFNTAISAGSVSQNQGTSTAEPWFYPAMDQQNWGLVPSAMAFNPSTGHLFVATADGSAVETTINPLTGGTARPSAFTGTATSVAVLDNQPAGHEQFLIGNGTSTLQYLDFDGTAFATANSFNGGNPVTVVAADNAGGHPNFFFRNFPGSSDQLGIYDATQTISDFGVYQSTSTFTHSGSSTSMMKPLTGALVDELIIANGNLLNGISTSAAANLIKFQTPSALSPGLSGAITGLVNGTGSYFGANVSGSLTILSNAGTPVIYFNGIGASGATLITGT